MATVRSLSSVSSSSSSASGPLLSIARISHGMSTSLYAPLCLCADKQLRPTVIVGLTLQQAIAMFVLKSGAGFSIFKWLAFLASDFLAQALSGATFFFDADIVQNKHWFFVNTVR